VPRGLDLGKVKYGGPFTTEQVEDVKAFYGILKVLFSFGRVFFLDFAANSVWPAHHSHESLH
jgi:peptide/histidine transporter 3/4